MARSSIDRCHGTIPYTGSHCIARAISPSRSRVIVSCCSDRSIWKTIFGVNFICSAISRTEIPIACRIARNHPCDGRRAFFALRNGRS